MEQMSYTQPELPNWSRLQQSLAIEAERGFNNLQGNQYRFASFLRITLQGMPIGLSTEQRQRWWRLTEGFGGYEGLGFADRQELVAEARRLFLELKQHYDGLAARVAEAQKESSQGRSGQVTSTNAPSTNAPRLVAESVERSRSVSSAAAGSAQSTPSELEVNLIPELDTPLTKVKGIGPKLGERLGKLGLLSVRDLLFYYPRDHLNYAKQVEIEALESGEMATLIGTVKRINVFTSPRNAKLTILDLMIKDRSGSIKLSRFYAGTRFASRGWQEQQKKMLAVGTLVAASGLVKEGKYGLTLDSAEIEVLESGDSPIESLKIGRLLPVYSLTEGITADMIRRAVVAVLPAASRLVDALPQGLRETHGLLDLSTAILQIHLPDDGDRLQQARRRLVFDEFFYLQLGLLLRRAMLRQAQTSVVLSPTGPLIDQFYKMLPFKFTGAQERVVNDILGDMQQTAPMNRLVQGDVGSGKTVVAVVALLAAIQAGYQGALMAPTEVLAEQHYYKMVGWFNLLHLPVELLTGSTKTAKRRQIHNQLKTGELPLLIGTHALIQDPVIFDRLGLAVIDEQHRFGVAQRAKLQQKGNNPHVLTMTATPIPRTLALTLHGDLDVSQIDELPPGRQAIQTTVLTGKDRPQAYELMLREIAQGHQVYVVLPLVEESEKLDLRSAIDEHRTLQETVFPDFKVGLLHGRMTSAEKEAAIGEFRDGKTQILVSTTVVEVGVDIPNASVMLIEHGERFGLSQLHQLRGRVGRGAAQSYCLLMSSSKSETAQQRLKVMEQSQDGFFISEMDMRFRGPGQVLGTRQSGLPDFALASLVEDQDVLELARQVAQKAIEKDPTLEKWPAMRAELNYRYLKLMGGAILT